MFLGCIIWVDVKRDTFGSIFNLKFCKIKNIYNLRINNQRFNQSIYLK